MVTINKIQLQITDNYIRIQNFKSNQTIKIIKKIICINPKCVWITSIQITFSLLHLCGIELP